MANRHRKGAQHHYREMKIKTTMIFFPFSKTTNPLTHIRMAIIKKNTREEEPRWRRSRTGRTLSPPQIHQKSI